MEDLPPFDFFVDTVRNIHPDMEQEELLNYAAFLAGFYMSEILKGQINVIEQKKLMEILMQKLEDK